ncbi:carbohydrate ABC transporter permease [Youxingia wuxianensis]|uniref:carbohydrate ABC transporter permease n=1 Tax=Youxingia wuxianensis TaxID=2763678 RepID=UPI0021CC81A4|nr:sugar ABC transporter permease [Youxingia wuxianensis]
MKTVNQKKSSANLVLLSSIILVMDVGLLWAIIKFLCNLKVHSVLYAIIGVLLVVLSVGFIFCSINWVVEQYPDKYKNLIQPFLYIGIAVLLLTMMLLLPAIETLYYSFFNASSSKFVGFSNYLAIFSDSQLIIALRNSALWVLFAATSCVALGLVIATLADRCSYEKLVKTIIFMPTAISYVAAGVIWKFVYFYQPGDQQIGLLNAIVVKFGGEPQAWTTMLPFWNNFFLMLIFVWMQTGYSMVLLSAAVKNIPSEIMEAARVDGAGEIRIFFDIIIPYIAKDIITVTTTIVVFCLKVFDIIQVMTGGQYGTDVVATNFYRQIFMQQNAGYGNTIAIVLLIIVTPVIFINLKNFRKQQGGALL